MFDPITIVIQIVAGVLLKRWPAVSNKLIPPINYGIAILKRFVESLVVGTAHAQADGGSAAAVFSPVADLLTTLISTGIHSAIKNLLQLFRKK